MVDYLERYFDVELIQDTEPSDVKSQIDSGLPTFVMRNTASPTWAMVSGYFTESSDGRPSSWIVLAQDRDVKAYPEHEEFLELWDSALLITPNVDKPEPSFPPKRNPLPLIVDSDEDSSSEPVIVDRNELDQLQNRNDEQAAAIAQLEVDLRAERRAAKLLRDTQAKPALPRIVLPTTVAPPATAPPERPALSASAQYWLCVALSLGMALVVMVLLATRRPCATRRYRVA